MSNFPTNKHYDQAVKLIERIFKGKEEKDIDWLIIALAKENDIRALKTLEMILFGYTHFSRINFNINHLQAENNIDGEDLGQTVPLNLSVSQLPFAYELLENVVEGYNLDYGQRDINGNTFYGNLADTCINQAERDHNFYNRPDIAGKSLDIIKYLCDERLISIQAPCRNDSSIYNLFTAGHNTTAELDSKIKGFMDKYMAEIEQIYRLQNKGMLEKLPQRDLFYRLYCDVITVPKGQVRNGAAMGYCFQRGDTTIPVTNKDIIYIENDVKSLIK